MAQINPLVGPPGTLITPPAVTTGREDELARPPRRDEVGLVLGGWLLYPSAFAGAVFDTNPQQRSTGGTSSAGLRLVPSLLAQYSNGIHKTALYGFIDGSLYTAQSGGSADALTASAGVTETYQPLPDLSFHGQVNLTRRKDLFATFGIDNGLNSLNSTGVGLSPTTNPVAYNQISAGISGQKNFSRAFLIGSGSVINITYDKADTGVSSPNGTTYSGTARGGFWVMPVLYGYLEGTGDSRNFATSTLSSSGYRVVGGLGSDQIGLFKGELYGGFQSEAFSSTVGTVGGPTYGGRIRYFPLPELTIDAFLDRSIGVSLLTRTSTSAIGTATQVTTALARASYSLASEWSATGRAGYIHSDYVDTTRRDYAWIVGATVNYSVWQNLGLTLDYQHLVLSSNVPSQSFGRDVVTLGVNYRY